VKLDGYVRVSRVGGRSGPSFISPQLQRDEIEAWARFRGAEIVKFHTDLDESGSKIDRPGLQRDLARVESGKTEGIVVAKLDRFARSLTGALETIKRLDQAGAVFISVAEGLDPTTPAGKMMMRLMLIMAEFELDRHRETWEQSRRRAVARGVHLAGRVPTGYRRTKSGRLVPSPKSAPQIATCFQMRAEYRSWAEIVDYVRDCGLTNPFGGAGWMPRSLMVLMRNRAYIGEARSGTFSVAGAHEPLVERGIWELAQLTRTLTTQTSTRPAPLSGLLRCGGCRYTMSPGGELSRDGSFRPRYYCKQRSAGGPCQHPAMVRGPEIEEVVEEAFFSLYEESPLRRRAREDSRSRAEAELTVAEEELDQAEGVESPSVAVESEVAALKLTVAAARERLIELTRSTLLPPPATLRASWPGLSVTERRRHLALLADAVILHPDRSRDLRSRVLVIPWGLAPVDLPHRNAKGTPVPLECSRDGDTVAVAGRGDSYDGGLAALSISQ
jgi:site-specific DNA recombinase